MAAYEDDSLLDETATHSASAPATPAHGQQNSAEDAATREANLRQELASVRKVNEAIEGVIESLNKAKANMKTVDQTVGAASALLNTWTRILSQTEHNQRLILDPTWQGASQDISDMDAEAQAKQDAAERKAVEEQERKAAAARKAEEDERRRAEAPSKPVKLSARGRGRGLGRGSNTAPSSTPSASSANTSMSSTGRGSSATRRTTSGIGRVRGVRGRT